MLEIYEKFIEKPSRPMVYGNEQRRRETFEDYITPRRICHRGAGVGGRNRL